MTAPITPAELDDLEALHAKAKQECFCRFACECGGLEAERKLEAVLPDAFPRLAAALRAAWKELEQADRAAKRNEEHTEMEHDALAARLAEAERLLRDGPKPDTTCIVPACDCLGCRIAAFLAQQTTPTAAAPQEQ